MKRTHSACPAAELAAYVDGALSHDEAVTIERHIDDCARCTALLTAYARTFYADAGASLVECAEATDGDCNRPPSGRP